MLKNQSHYFILYLNSAKFRSIILLIEMNKGYVTSTPKPESTAFKSVLQEKFVDNGMAIRKQFVFSNR